MFLHPKCFWKMQENELSSITVPFGCICWELSFFFWRIRIWMFPTLGSCKENYTACENYTVRTLSKCDRLRTRKLQNASWWYVIILKFSRSKTTGGHTHTYILVKQQSLGFPEDKGNKQNKQLLPGHWFHALNRLRLHTNQCLLHYLSPFERRKLHATNNKMASSKAACE